MNAWDDPRIARGMEKQLGQRRARIAAGEKPIGWKVGLGAKPAMERLGITDAAGRLHDAEVARCRTAARYRSPAGPSRWPSRRSPCTWRADLAGGADRAATIAAIGALGPAIELADLNPPPSDVEAALAGNIFHRHVILGPSDAARAGREARRPRPGSSSAAARRRPGRRICRPISATSSTSLRMWPARSPPMARSCAPAT